jgi:methyltransferase (TIGR00027 family)
MEASQYSRTALATAFFRAYHVAHDQPLIFEDSQARALLGEETYAKLAQHFSQSLKSFDPERAASNPDPATALAWCLRAMGAPAVILCRARYAEDCLAQAIQKGMSQYVILGAGMDTFALRHPEMSPGLRVLEIDHPATQAYKRQRLEAAGLAIPEAQHFMPVDLAKQSLATALQGTVYDAQALTFFSWLGVTYYLTTDEVMTTLGAIAQVAPSGSVVVFDYLDTQALPNEHDDQRRRALRERVRSVGEPMRSGLHAGQLPDDLASLGLRLLEDLAPADLERLYLAGRTDGYRFSQNLHLARAEVMDRGDRA